MIVLIDKRLGLCKGPLELAKRRIAIRWWFKRSKKITNDKRGRRYNEYGRGILNQIKTKINRIGKPIYS